MATCFVAKVHQDLNPPPQAGHKVKEKAKVARTNSSWLEMDSFYSLGGLTMETPHVQEEHHPCN